MGIWSRVFRRQREFAELSEEMRGHLDERVEELVTNGMERREAKYQARREFGNFSLVEHDGRRVWKLRLVDDLLADLRFGFRMLRRSPAFTIIAVSILAVGIGSNAAVFSLINALLLRKLDVVAPEQLVAISFGQAGATDPLSGPMFDRLRERQSAFVDLFAWNNQPMVLNDGGSVVPIQGAYASGSAFPILGVRPRLGRMLDWQEDEMRGNSHGLAAVISEAFWQQHFGASENVLGRTVLVNGTQVTIVGVIPRSFNGMTVDYAPQMVLPFAAEVAIYGRSSSRFDAGSRWLFTTGRLKPGVSLRQAEANVATISEDVLRESLPEHFQESDSLRDGRFHLSPEQTGNSPLGELYGRSLWTLQGLVGLLLVICCANFATLQISRSIQRRQEFAVRNALGAKRSRLVRQLAVESGSVAAVGAACGLLLSTSVSALLVRYVEQSDFPLFLDLHPDAPVLALTTVLTTVVVVLAGVLPSIGLARSNSELALSGGMKQRFGQGRSTTRWQSRLLPVQIALSIVLVAVALLFAASARNLLHADLGFRIQGITMFGANFEQRPEKGGARRELYRRILDLLRRSPGIESASVLAMRPLNEGGIDQNSVAVEVGEKQDKRLFKNIVGGGYFATAGTKVLAGREFLESDRSNTAHVCVLNDAAANYFFGGPKAVGNHIRSLEIGDKQPVCEVVGVVANANYNSVRQMVPPTIYYSFEQSPPDFDLSFITRSENTASAAVAYREALRTIAPDTPLLPAITMERQLEDSVGQERLLASVSVFFGVIALVLTCMGLYGLEMQRVTARTPEIGLRMALGARRRDMLWSVMREAGMFLTVGVPVGLALSIGSARFVERLLFEVSVKSSGIYFVAAGAVMAAALGAALLPAKRATGVEPMVALRHE
jgi:predicted permease